MNTGYVTAAGRISLDHTRRRVRWDVPGVGTRYSPKLPVGRNVRAKIVIPGIGRLSVWVHITPPRTDPQGRTLRTAYRRRQVARRRRNRR